MESKSYSLSIFNSADQTLFVEKVDKSKGRSTTVAKLLETLNERFMAWDGELLGGDRIKLQPDWTMSYIRKLGSFVYNPAIASTEAWNQYKLTKQREKVKIMVKEATGDLNELEVFRIISGFELYEKIKIALKMEQDQEFKLSIKKVGEIEPTKEYTLEDEQILHLSQNQSGGGATVITFVDVTNFSNSTIRQWAKSAPKWRITSPGLTVEGKCQTSECEAHSSYVIINKKFGSYDIQMDDHTNKCPLCNQYVKAEKVGFNNCVYSFKGVIFKGYGNAPQKASRQNITVGDYYELFDPQNVGNVDWINLTFDVYSSSRPTQICVICLDDSSKTPLKTFDGKFYHVNCRVISFISETSTINGSFDQDTD